MRKINAHHHGNLKQALVAAGLEILNKEGLPALTLRKCAARAGVSHAAPAHHFNGLAGLLDAIAACGYKRFTDTMNDHRKNANSEPMSQLLAICEGYLQFARDNEALFTLMFSSQQLRFDDSNLCREADRAYDILAQCCAALKHKSGTSEKLEIAVWSMVHGFAVLTGAANTRASSNLHPASNVNFRDLICQIVGHDEVRAKYDSNQ
jgi:AcrR family transcriptional regulator